MSYNIAYHYTSLDSLYKIVTTKSLLLTDLAGMNDPEEGKYSPEDSLEDLKKGKDSFLKDENSIKFFDVIITELETRNDERMEFASYVEIQHLLQIKMEIRNYRN